MRVIPRKRVSPEQVRRFWADYDAHGRRSTRILRFFRGGRFRQPVAFSASLLGTVRLFYDRRHLMFFLNKVNRLNRFFRDRKQEHFVFQPVQILHIDRKNFRLVERVYRFPNVDQIITPPMEGTYGFSLYQRLVEKMKKKGVSHSEWWHAVMKAYDEYSNMVDYQSDIYLDVRKANTVVLDYDPKTKKVLLAQVDPGSSIKM